MDITIEGEREVLIELKVPCEVYSRIVGYLRPVQYWNKAKQAEFANRKVFKNPSEEQLEEVEKQEKQDEER